MRAVVILTIVALFGAVACWKPVFHPRWNMTKNHTHHNHTHHHNHTKNHTWNSKGYKFAEETAPAPSFVQKMKNHAKKLWAKRPWKKSAPAPAPVAPEASFFIPMKKWNLSLQRWNISNPTHKWNPKGFKFVEEEAKPQTFVDKIKHHAKKLWAKRPWKKATPAPVPETSSWNPAGHHIHHWNHTNKTHNHTHHHNHTKNHTWNNKGWRFDETAPAQGLLHTIKHHAKKIWAKRPWKKTAPAPAPVAPESSSWNSAGYHFPTWNHTNTTNHTWNNQGYRFEETAAPSVFDKITNTVKGIWAKRPWKKAD